MEVGELEPGLWWWTARGPEGELRCFYAETDEATLVIDALVPDGEEERFWAALDRDVERRARPVAVLLTHAARATSAGALAARYAGEVWGPEEARAATGDGASFHALAPDAEVPGARVLDLDAPPGWSGAPLHLPSHGAIAAGDVFVSRADGLRVRWGHGATDDVWYRERLLPSLRRWLELEPRHVLVADGPVVSPDELSAALHRPPDGGE